MRRPVSGSRANRRFKGRSSKTAKLNLMNPRRGGWRL
jgi:hypothetical protein